MEFCRLWVFSRSFLAQCSCFKRLTPIAVARPLIYATVASISAFLVLIGVFLVSDVKKNRRRNEKKSQVASATVLKELESADSGYLYQIKVNGEIWKCFSDQPLELKSSIRL